MYYCGLYSKKLALVLRKWLMKPIVWSLDRFIRGNLAYQLLFFVDHNTTTFSQNLQKCPPYDIIVGLFFKLPYKLAKE
jgi:hypothetical protein